MAFKLAGQNPAVDGLIHRPSDRSEVRTLELRPGMDGFSGPPTLETIPNYDPSKDSGLTTLVARKPDEMAQKRYEDFVMSPDFGDTSDIRRALRDTQVLAQQMLLATSNSDPRFAAVETILPLLVGGVPGSSPYDTFNPSDYDPLLRPENQWDRYEEPSEPDGQLELPIELVGMAPFVRKV